MNQPIFILASGSPRRLELLKRLKFPFQVRASEAQEMDADDLTPRELAMLNAYLKTQWVARREPGVAVLGADTLVFTEKARFGKPRTRREAQEMLLALGGQTHQVVTGVCLLRWQDRRRLLFSEVTQVTFRPLSRDDIKDYLESVDPLDKAGGYAIQERGDWLVEALHGSYTNVMGLPLEEVRAALEAFVLPGDGRLERRRTALTSGKI